MPETSQPRCEVCGEPMPAGEEMFKFHGYSSNCPKPMLPREAKEGPSPSRIMELVKAATSVIAHEVQINPVHRHCAIGSCVLCNLAVLLLATDPAPKEPASPT